MVDYTVKIVSCIDNADEPGTVSVEVPIDSTGLQVMENAVLSFGSHEEFTVTYEDFGVSAGYYIDKVNGIPIDDNEPCYWAVFSGPSGEEIYSNVGIAEVIFNAPDMGLKLCFTDRRSKC